MNYWTRSVLSVTRNKPKTLLLFFLTLIIGILVAGTFLVNRASVRAIDNVIGSMRPQGMMGIDRREMFYTLTDIRDDSFTNALQSPILFPRIDIKSIHEMGDLPYIVEYDFYFERHLFSTEIDRYVASYDGFYLRENRKYGLGYGFMIRGVSNPNFIEIVQNIIEITSGRTFTEDEFSGAYPVAIISEGLALENQLTIGSIMPFESVVLCPREVFCVACITEDNVLGSLNYDVEIIGIFRISPNIFSQDPSDRRANVTLLDNLSNQIYASSSFVEQIDRETRQLAEFWDFYTLLSGHVDEPSIYTPPAWYYYMASEYYAMDVVSIFQLRSPHDEIPFIESVEPLIPDFHMIEFMNNDYRMIINALENMISITNSILYLMIGAMILILTLLIILIIRERKHEIGIYFTMGENKIRVALQIMIEVFIITIPALVIALFAGNIIGNQIAEYLLINDLLAEIESGRQEQVWSLFFMFGLGGEMNINTLTANYDTALTIGRVFAFLAVGLGTVLLATAIPLVYMFRMNPKKILM